MIHATAQLVLLHVNVETVGDVVAFAVRSDQLVLPDGYIVLERPGVRKSLVKGTCFLPSERNEGTENICNQTYSP